MMPLSPAVTKALKRELTDLTRMRGRFDARISALQTILKVDRTGEGAPEVRATGPHQNAPKRMKSAGKHRAKPPRGSLRTTLSALIEKTPGLRSGGIIHALEQTGFALGGKTSLQDRVYRELRQLRRLGVIRKDSSGAYVLVKKNQHEPQREGVNRAEPVGVDVV